MKVTEAYIVYKIAYFDEDFGQSLIRSIDSVYATEDGARERLKELSSKEQYNRFDYHKYILR